MRASLRLIVVLATGLAAACGASAPRPTSTTSNPSTTTAGSASSSTSTTSASSEADQPTLDEAPKLGFLERRADGTCWYGTNPAGPLQRVVTCPPTMAETASKTAPTEDAPQGGYLEKVVESGTCWWSLHAPYDCPAGAVCKPDPPVDRVRCP